MLSMSLNKYSMLKVTNMTPKRIIHNLDIIGRLRVHPLMTEYVMNAIDEKYLDYYFDKVK